MSRATRHCRLVVILDLRDAGNTGAVHEPSCSYTFYFSVVDLYMMCIVASFLHFLQILSLAICLAMCVFFLPLFLFCGVTSSEVILASYTIGNLIFKIRCVSVTPSRFVID